MREKEKVYGKLALAALMTVGVLCFPVEAAEAARAAMAVWATAFAPALFPFFVVLPALCCPEAAALYERWLGRAMKVLFGCPGRAAGAVVIAWMAGSPAGAVALSRVKGGMTRAQLSRAQALCSGTSPAFLIASVGAMMGSVETGHLLMRAQLLAMITSGLILRRAWAGDDEAVPEAIHAEASQAHPVREAVINVLTVCGWMVFFGVLSRLVTMALPAARLVVLPLLEVAGGTAALAESALPSGLRILAVAFACGLSGLSIALQNRAQLPDLPWQRLALSKLLQGSLCALFAALQLPLSPFAFRIALSPLSAALLLSGSVTIIVWLAHRILSTGRES